ncbi:MAG: hypothetical protein ACE5F7_10170 [Nitrospiria bacterium]
MKTVHKTTLILFAYLLSIWFILDPAPLQMALFVFIAQPLILFVAAAYVIGVLRDLKKRHIL